MIGPLAHQRKWLAQQAVGEVLEVRTGTGAMLPHYPTCIRLTALDASTRRLAVAHQTTWSTQGIIHWVGGLGEALPFATERFDTLVFAATLCSVHDPQAALQDAHRILHPDGRLILLEQVRSTNH